jgi:hypothetical protein
MVVLHLILQMIPLVRAHQEQYVVHAIPVIPATTRQATGSSISVTPQHNPEDLLKRELPLY